MHATNGLFTRWHTLFAYNFFMNGPISTVFSMKMGDNQNIYVFIIY